MFCPALWTVDGMDFYYCVSVVCICLTPFHLNCSERVSWRLNTSSFLSLVFIFVYVWLHFCPPPPPPPPPPFFSFLFMYSEILHGHSLSLNMTAFPILFTVLVFPQCIWLKTEKEACLYTIFFLLKRNFVSIAIKWLKTWFCNTHAYCCVQVMRYMLSLEFRLWVITYILAEAVSGLERWSTHGGQHLNIKIKK